MKSQRFSHNLNKEASEFFKTEFQSFELDFCCFKSLNKNFEEFAFFLTTNVSKSNTFLMSDRPKLPDSSGL